MSLDNPLLWPEVRWTEPDLFASMPEFYHNKIRLPKNALYNDSENPSKAGTILTRQFHNTFTESLVIPSPQSDDLNPTFTPPQNTGTWEDFTPMFLEQARLYVLADKYGIERLCQLVIFKLYQTLRTFKLYDTGVSAIIEFVRFVYLNTPPNYGKVDALRNLATSYVVSVLGQIGRNECFETLLEEGGPFVSDFFHILRSVA
ncbi:hypothetical protein N7471_012773 [Penicillium samsonianum]|uniref:uncharacterized protein n=1 Tax=Penicillium samsonianum TaxID=1882272 RepID=UPI0025481CA5|nr:uncharacterized protein N7471_012773 [Penicillium samsonianum]KAJ6125456.1 hypothetical protein N7471_012773 [Penicillium samsonianum]